MKLIDKISLKTVFFVFLVWVLVFKLTDYYRPPMSNPMTVSFGVKNIQPYKAIYLLPKQIDHYFLFDAQSNGMKFTALNANENGEIVLDNMIPSALNVVVRYNDDKEKSYSLKYIPDSLKLISGTHNYELIANDNRFYRRDYISYHTKRICLFSFGLIALLFSSDLALFRKNRKTLIVNTSLSVLFSLALICYLYRDLIL